MYYLCAANPMNETMKRILLSLLLMLPLINAVSQESPQVAALRTPNLTTVQMSDQEAEFMRFLYAYMPMADVTDYTVEFHLENVRATLEAREQMPWGKTVPELLFKHFVLPLRVNNEALDLSRPVFYRELKERVQGMTMEEAILEVNHWCHEHVTYQPSDSRTLSPLACMNTAIGRCGEESTFTVAALRSIGIPARQVYTPRWAHTDDNHAWVEAWANGRWHFLGACEPEAVLDLGWFNAPASRALLMHTRAFGDYQGPEEVMSRTRNFTEINLIGNYAATARVQVQVLDRSGLIRFMHTEPLPKYFIPGLIRGFLEKGENQGVRIESDISGTGKIVDALLRDEITFGFCSDPPSSVEGLTLYPLIEEPIVLVASRTDPLCRLQLVTPQDLASRPCISYGSGSALQQQLDSFFEKWNIQPDICYRSSAVQISNLVAQGLGWAFIVKTDTAPSDRIAVLNMPELTMKRRTYLAVRTERPLSNAAERFRDYVLEYSADRT